MKVVTVTYCGMVCTGTSYADGATYLTQVVLPKQENLRNSDSEDFVAWLHAMHPDSQERIVARIHSVLCNDEALLRMFKEKAEPVESVPLQ